MGEQTVPGTLADHAYGQAVGRIGAGEDVLDVEVPVRQMRLHLGIKPLEMVLRQARVDLAPPDLFAARRLIDDELVPGRAPGVLAGEHHQSPAFGEFGRPGLQAVLIEGCGAEIPISFAIIANALIIQAVSTHGLFTTKQITSPR